MGTLTYWEKADEWLTGWSRGESESELPISLQAKAHLKIRITPAPALE